MNAFHSFAQTIVFFTPFALRHLLPPQIRHACDARALAGWKEYQRLEAIRLGTINIPAGDTMSYVPRHSNNNDSYTNENYVPKHSKVDAEFDVINVDADADTEVLNTVRDDEEQTWERLESKVDEVLAFLEKDREGFLQMTKK